MRLSWSRWVGIIIKEFIQLKRDRLTFGMIIGIPVLQLVLFGYAINSDPKLLPTAVLSADSGPYSRTLIAAMQTSGYFRIDRFVSHESEIEDLLARGEVLFAVTIPENFDRKLVRGERPVLLVEADATDLQAIGNAVSALTQVAFVAAARPERRARGAQGRAAAARDARAPALQPRGHHRLQHRAGPARHHPHHDDGAHDRPRDDARARARHLREPALHPALPIEVMTGKIVPYILIGLIQ